MAIKPTYEELLQRVLELEQEKREWNTMKAAAGRHKERPVSETEPGSHVPEINLGDIINAEELQSIMDDFCNLTNMVTAVLDTKGNIIEATGWQDACTRFHRIHPEASFHCTKSDLFLAENLKPGEYVDYKCKNGLWDVVTPLHIGTKHLGNIYTGQFFYDDEKIDETFFIKQAEIYDFDKDAYLEAIRRVPKYSRETVRHLMGFLVKFTSYISRIGIANIQLEKEIHEREQAQTALKESETQLRSLIRTIPDPVWLKDSEGRYLSCNARFESLLGAQEKDIIGKTDYDFVNKELADSFRMHDKAAMAQGKPSKSEEDVVFAEDGHREFLETIKTPMYGSDGHITGVLGIGRDITDRKRTEEIRRESEAFIKLIMDNLPIGLAVNSVDPNVDFEYMNDNFPLFYRTTREALSDPDSFWTSVYEDSDFREKIKKRVLDDCAGNDPERMHWEDVPITRKGEEATFITAQNTPVPDKQLMISTVWDVTERKKAERLLRASENRLRELIQLIPAALLVYNAEMGVSESNMEAQRLLGMNAEQLRGKKVNDPVWSLVREDGSSMPVSDYPISQALTQKIDIRDRVVGLVDPEEGGTKWLMINSVPELDAHGNVINIIVTFFDITERMEAREALRVSEERLKLAGEAANDGLWDWNMQTGYVYFNPRYYTMLDYEPYEMPPSYETWAGLLHPEDREAVETGILSHIENKTGAFEYEFRLREKAGTWRWILGKGQVFERDRNGKPLRVLGTHTDIDNLKRIQAELYESRKKYWGILNNVELGIVMISPKMEILEANRKMKQWYPQLEEADKPICYQLAFNPPKSAPCDGCPAIRTFSDGQIHEEILETKLNEKDTVFRVISSPIHDDQGRIVSVIRMMEDITVKRRLELEVRQSQKIESLGTLAGGIAHDFNNILSVILGFAELTFADTQGESDLNDNIKEIITAGKRAKDLVKRILAFSRQTEQEYKPIHITPIVQESVRLMKSVLPSTVRIHEEYGIDSDVIMSDPTQLHQIIVNLCTNAGHAMEEKGGRLDISLHRVPVDKSMQWDSHEVKTGDYLLLGIQDSGHGIPPEIKEKIYDPYFTTKEEGKGSGLGLSVVYGLVKMHGGHIAVTSEMGKGTTVRIYLPIVDQKAVDPWEKTMAPLKSGSEHILLIDDEVSILKMLRQILERLGYTITLSDDSNEALELFRSSPDTYDLIITDMTMPGIAGDDLARLIKNIRSDVPIILCTGFSTRVDGENATDLPIDGLLMKPVGKAELAKTIRKILDSV